MTTSLPPIDEFPADQTISYCAFLQAVKQIQKQTGHFSEFPAVFNVTESPPKGTKEVSREVQGRVEEYLRGRAPLEISPF